MIRILLAEDQAMVRGALAALLTLEGDFTIVAEVDNGADVVARALATRPSSLLINQVDTADLARAHVRVVVASLWPPFAVRPGRSGKDNVLVLLERLRAFVSRHPEVGWADNARAARSRLARGQLAFIPAVEGGEGISSVADVDAYYAAGVRLLTVLHMQDSRLGGAAANQVGHAFGLSAQGPNSQGLTALGRDVVRRMMQLGMMVDVAHASDVAADEILSLAEAAGVPVLDTHAGARAFVDVERNVTDARAARIARGGGMVGTTLFRDFVLEVPPGSQWPGFGADSCDDVVAHWAHLAQAAGAEAIALGSDWNGMARRPGVGGSCPQGLRSTADLPALYDALAAHGLPTAALDSSGERLLELWDRVEAKADPRAQAEARRSASHPAGAFDIAL